MRANIHLAYIFYYINASIKTCKKVLCAGKNETEKKMAPAVNLMLTQNIKLHLRSSFCAVRLALETKLDSIIEKKLKKVYLLVSINKSPEKN